MFPQAFLFRFFSEMAVFGVDFGNLNSVVSVARKGGIDIIVNEVSKRETSSMVSFGENERYLGEKAANLPYGIGRIPCLH